MRMAAGRACGSAGVSGPLKPILVEIDAAHAELTYTGIGIE
jgi:hypothetical protein